MRYIKFAVCAAFASLILCLHCGFTLNAKAEGKQYVCAAYGSPVYFCSEKSKETALFSLPQTYCAEILGSEGDWYYVKYAEDDGVYRALYGYCLKDGVTVLDEPPENVYLHTVLKIPYKTESPDSVLPPLEGLEMEAAYYGAYTVGQTEYSYVLCNGSFGYVTQTVKNYPMNELPSKPAFSENGTGDGAKLITALVITGIAAAAVIALFINGKKTKLTESNDTST